MDLSVITAASGAVLVVVGLAFAFGPLALVACGVVLLALGLFVIE